MGLFYAYLKYVEPNNDYQQLVTFANRETADEWWRAISAPPSYYAGHVKRISPQFYVQNSGADVAGCLDNPRSPNTSQFLETLFFTQIIVKHGGSRTLENPTSIPPAEITDHISGGWYFIRSKSDPFSRWYLGTSGACLVCGVVDCNTVHVSSEYRTHFCVRVRSDAEVPEDFVMVGKDEITISARKGYILYINDTGDVKATKGYQGETDLLFSDLKKRFVVRVEKQVNGEVWEYVESVERGAGEAWELVE